MHRARATQRWRRAARPRSSRSRLWAGATTRRARRPTCTCRCFSSTCWRSCRATTRLRKGSPSPRRRSLCAFRGLSEGAGPAGSSSSSSLRARRGETARPLTPPPRPPNTTQHNKTKQTRRSSSSTSRGATRASPARSATTSPPSRRATRRAPTRASPTASSSPAAAATPSGSPTSRSTTSSFCRRTASCARALAGTRRGRTTPCFGGRPCTLSTSRR